MQLNINIFYIKFINSVFIKLFRTELCFKMLRILDYGKIIDNNILLIQTDKT